MELARLGAAKEAGFDRVVIGHAAPQPFELIAAIFGHPARPARFGVGGAEPVGDTRNRLFAAFERQVGGERTRQRECLDDRGVKAARDIAHQRAHAARMFDQFAQIGARAGPALGFEHHRRQAGIDEIIVERAVILHIDFGTAARDFVERRLGDVEMPRLDDLRHLTIEEGEQQRADMRAVDVCVGHDDDLVVAQLFEVEILAADAGAQRLDERADFLRREHAIEARALDVQDLALEREDRLIMAIAPLLGRSACGVTLDEEEFGLGRIAFLAVGKLAGERGDIHHPLAPGKLARLAGGFARGGGVNHLLDDRLGVRGIFLEPFGHLVRHQAFERLAHLGRDELVLGLRAELGIGQLDRDDRGQPFAHVVAGERDLFLLQQPRFLGIAVERARQRGAEGGEMGAAIALRDVVGEAEDVFVIAVVPLQRDLDADTVTLARNRDGISKKRGLRAVEPLHERADAAFVEQFMLHLFLVPGIDQEQPHARVEEGEFAVAMLELRKVEFGDLEGRGAGEEGDARPLLAVGRADNLERRLGIAVAEAHIMLFAVAPDVEIEPFGERVDDRDAHAVQAARHLIGVVVRGVLELPARVELGHDHLGGGDAFFGVDARRNPAAIILDRDRTIGVELDDDPVAMPGQRLVDRVVRHFEHHVVQARAVIGIADIHARPLANRIEALQDLDRLCTIFIGIRILCGIVTH